MPEVWGAGVRRPLTARSVIASTLLGVDPPRLPAAALVRSGELFGLREGATRTALSRMAAAGELEADDGHYVLSGALLDRHARQRQARRGADTPAQWDGTWLLAVVTGDRRPAGARAAFRASARRLGLREVREGLWARPDDGRADRAGRDRDVVDDQAVRVRGARPESIEPFLDAFDLDGWAAVARTLVAEMHQSMAALEDRRTDVLSETFVVSAAVLRHLLEDPVLPAPLLPSTWPGDELRTTYERFDSAFKETWGTWFRSIRPD